MKPRFAPLYALTLVVAVLFSSLAAARAKDPLPSWNDGTTKQAIVAFVHKTTTPGPGFVPPEERVATFDNDGTLWAEKPMYVQVFFALDRVRDLAPQHPEWQTQEPFASVLKGDLKAALASGDKALIQIVMATHAGMTTAEFEAIVRKWITTARHPQTGRLYTEMVYQPMLELLRYLRANGFRTYIVSGGSIEFMRPWTAGVYGVPPEQVIGSSIRTEFQMTDDGPVLMRLPQLDFINDKAGKPVGIDSHIGIRPVAAFGNSDGDLQMLQWATMWPGGRFGLLVRHTDAEREYAYDTGSEAALAEAQKQGWTVVDMQKDWKAIYAPLEKQDKVGGARHRSTEPTETTGGVLQHERQN